MTEYNEAIKRPFTDWLKFAIGALLYMIPIVNVVTHFFGTGYMLKCVRSATRKNYKLPEWENWSQLFVQGLFSLIIGIIYILPATIIGLLIVGSELYNMFFTGFNLWVFLDFIFSGNLIIVGLLLVLALYVFPAGLVMFATRDKFSSAFDFKTIFKKAFTGKYLLDWVISVAYGIIIGFVISTLFVSLIATIVLPWVVFGAGLFTFFATAATIFGETWNEIKEK